MTEIIFALFAALMITAVFAVWFRRPGPWAPLWSFFVVVFMAGWAASLWMRPAGPLLLNVYWVPLLFVALMVALVLAAAGPSSLPTREAGSAAGEGPSRAPTTELGRYFWLLLTALLLTIVAGYTLRDAALVV